MIGCSNTVPFCNNDISYCCTLYLGVQDLGSMMRVCKGWKAWVNREVVVWKNASEHDKIPIVAGEGRNYKEDLKIIRPLVSSIHGLLGKVLGPVPPIRQEMFRKFTSNDPDPYGEGDFKHHFVLLINPSHIERRVGRETPLALQDGKLIEVDPSQVKDQTITIPATIPNLLTLFKFPLKGKEHLPVHRISEELRNALFEQCTFFPAEVGVSFMRKNIIEESRNMDFALQVILVEQKAPGGGYSVRSAQERLLFDAERILKTGDCPDSQNPRSTSVRGTETVAIYGGACYLDVGDFVPDAGVFVYYDSDLIDGIGVVPGGSAEVLRPLELGHLAI